MAGRLRIGLALGAGGARGWCHVGVIRELQALGIRIDAIAGCSMGALVGAALAGGRLDAFEAWGRELTLMGLLRRVDLGLSGGGFVRGGEVAGVLEEIGVPDRIEALDIPFGAVATDLATGRERWFRDRGPVADAVRASVSIPGVFSPHPVDGAFLVDGGLVNPVPVSLARALGADLVIAVHPNARPGGRYWRAEPEAPAADLFEALRARLPAPFARTLASRAGRRSPAYLDVVTATVDIMSETICRARLAGEPPDVLLAADLAHITALELHRASEAIEHGRQMVARMRPALEALRDAAG